MRITSPGNAAGTGVGYLELGKEQSLGGQFWNRSATWFLVLTDWTSRGRTVSTRGIRRGEWPTWPCTLQREVWRSLRGYEFTPWSDCLFRDSFDPLQW